MNTLFSLGRAKRERPSRFPSLKTLAMTTTTFRDFVASKIQAAWRRARDRRAYLKRRRAVVVIQSRFRRNARREKVRVAVRAFSALRSDEPVPKTEAWLEPSTTRARAFPGLRLRVRTETHRETARGGARRCLDGFSV